ncbi:hypothetical protein JCM10207_004694 [Rhodosporidiobolus poonsookiae]
MLWTGLLLAAAGYALAQEPPQVLVYSRTVGYRHASIPAAQEAIRNIATNTSLFTPSFSEAGTFTDDDLAPYKAIVFLSNSDQVLDDAGEAALKQWFTTGGSLIGLHAGTACLFNDTAFGTAMGSWFDYHPDISNATFLKVIEHETVNMLPDRYDTYEEVHHFRSDPRDVNCTVLLTFDPDSFSDPQAGTRPYYQGTPPPSAWLRDGQDYPVDLTNGTAGLSAATMTGRTWFTSLGHEVETWSHPIHLAHVEAGFRWALEPFNGNSSSATSSSISSGSATAAPSSSGGSPTAAAPSSTDSGANGAGKSGLAGGSGVLYALGLSSAVAAVFLLVQ